jgi:hypothetical protein
MHGSGQQWINFHILLGSQLRAGRGDSHQGACVSLQVVCSACGAMQMISEWRAAADAAHLRLPLCEGAPLGRGAIRFALGQSVVGSHVGFSPT